MDFFLRQGWSGAWSVEGWIYRVEWAWEWGMERGGKEYTEWDLERGGMEWSRLTNRRTCTTWRTL